MAAHIARTHTGGAWLALLGWGGLILCATPGARAAWTINSTFLSEGRCYVLLQTLDADHTNSGPWALTPDGIIRYSLNNGLTSILAPTGSGANPLIDPICALRGSSNTLAAYDEYDGRLKYFTDSGSFQDAILGDTGDGSSAGLVTRVFHGVDGPVVASYSFADHRARVLRFSRDGYLLNSYSSDASSPGQWDWIFDLMPYSSGFLVYVYEGDGITGHSWIEYRAWDGHLISLLHQRTEYSLPPYWYASRAMIYQPGKTYFYLLAPGTGPGLTDLVVSQFDGTIINERSDLSDVIPEPWLRLTEFGTDNFAILGQYTDARRPGHAYVLDANGNTTATYQETPGPVGEVYHPRGIAPLADGTFWLSDTDNYRLNHYSAQGVTLSSSEIPTRLGQLGVLPDGTLVGVNLDEQSDPDLGGVVHMAADGHVLGTWGMWGSGDGQLAAPSDLAVGPDGNIYVADTLNSRVEVLDGSGAFVRAWGSPGESPSGQYEPIAIAALSDRVYTVESLLGGGSRVLVFSPTGTYLREWTTAATLVDLEATADHTLYGLTTTGSIITYDELGRAEEVSATVPGTVGALNSPAAFRLGGNTLYVADTGNSRVATFVQETPVVKISLAGPTLVPRMAGVRLRLLGDELPSDLSAQIVPSTGAPVTGSVTWLNPGEADATFDLSGVTGTSADLWVWGTGLPAVNVEALTLSVYLAPALVGGWEGRQVDGLGDPTGSSGESLNIAPDGKVTWEKLDGSGEWRTGKAASVSGQVVICYTGASPPLTPETVAYNYAFANHLLTLTPQDPYASDGVTYWSTEDGAGLLDPAVSGRWNLTSLDQGSGPAPVTWNDTLTVDLDGAYTRVSDRSGSTLTYLGQMTAHDTQLSRSEAAATSVAGQVTQTGSYSISGDDLTIHITLPQTLTEVWHRVAESGARPLPWVTLRLPPRLYHGMAATAVVTVGNHGSIGASDVYVSLALPWLAGGQRVVSLPALGPGEIDQYSVTVTAPTDQPNGAVSGVATAVTAAPEASTVQDTEQATVSDPMLDLAVRFTFPTTCVPDGLITSFIYVDSNGVDPSTVIPADALDTPALTLTRTGAVDIAAGGDSWTPSSLTIKWSTVLAALAGKTEANWRVYVRAQSTVGAVGSLQLALDLPPGVPEASSEDNTARASVVISNTISNVQVNLQPYDGVKPGGQLAALITLASDAGETWHLRGIVLEVDPAIDLYSATPTQGASFDLFNNRVSWALAGNSIGSDPTRNVTYTQMLTVPPDTPDGTVLTFRATGYFDDHAPIVSDDAHVVVARSIFGDLNDDGKVDGADLAQFMQGYRNAALGVYDSQYDLAPTEGTPPLLISHPDGVIDHRDAQAMLEAYLYRGN